MTLTLVELQEKLNGIDEISLLEILNIDSEQIVEKFVDKIETNYERLVHEFDDEDEQNPQWEED